MAIQGVPKFDALALLEIEAIRFNGTSPAVVAHAAYVNLTDGNTYGRTTCRNFSKATMDKLIELRECMEQDMAALVFESSEAHASNDGALGPKPVGGISEYLGAADKATSTDAEQL